MPKTWHLILELSWIDLQMILFIPFICDTTLASMKNAGKYLDKFHDIFPKSFHRLSNNSLICLKSKVLSTFFLLSSFLFAFTTSQRSLTDSCRKEADRTGARGAFSSFSSALLVTVEACTTTNILVARYLQWWHLLHKMCNLFFSALFVKWSWCLALLTDHGQKRYIEARLQLACLCCWQTSHSAFHFFHSWCLRYGHQTSRDLYTMYADQSRIYLREQTRQFIIRLWEIWNFCSNRF